MLRKFSSTARNTITVNKKMAVASHVHHAHIISMNHQFHFDGSGSTGAPHHYDQYRKHTHTAGIPSGPYVYYHDEGACEHDHEEVEDMHVAAPLWDAAERRLLRAEWEKGRQQQQQQQQKGEKQQRESVGEMKGQDTLLLHQCLEMGAVDLDKWVVLQVTQAYGGMRLDRFLRTRQMEQQRMQRHIAKWGAKRESDRSGSDADDEAMIFVPTMTVFQKMIRKNAIKSISAETLEQFRKYLSKSANATEMAGNGEKLRAEICKNNDRVHKGDVILVLKKAVEGYGEKITAPKDGGSAMDADAKRSARILRESSRLTKRQIEEVKSWVLFENDECIVINKPSGLAVHGGSKQMVHVDMLLAALAPGLADVLLTREELRTKGTPHWDDAFSVKEKKMRQNNGSKLLQGDIGATEMIPSNPQGTFSIPKLVHRLDKDTSGCLVLAKTRDAAHRLSDWLKPVWGKQYTPRVDYHRKKYHKEVQRARETEHERVRDVVLKKCYWAVVKGKPLPSAGRIKMPLQRSYSFSEGSDKVFVSETMGDMEKKRDVKMAISEYDTVDHVLEELSWLALYPQTGRLHQLRVHCTSGLGCSILGDEKYGIFSEERSDNPFPESLAHIFAARKEPVHLHLHARSVLLPYPFVKQAHSNNPNLQGFDNNNYTMIKAPLPSHMAETFEEFEFDIAKGDKRLFSFKKAY